MAARERIAERRLREQHRHQLQETIEKLGAAHTGDVVVLSDHLHAILSYVRRTGGFMTPEDQETMYAAMKVCAGFGRPVK